MGPVSLIHLFTGAAYFASLRRDYYFFKSDFRSQDAHKSINDRKLDYRRISRGQIKARIPQELVRLAPICQKESFSFILVEGAHGQLWHLSAHQSQVPLLSQILVINLKDQASTEAFNSPPSYSSSLQFPWFVHSTLSLISVVLIRWIATPQGPPIRDPTYQIFLLRFLTIAK